MFASLAGNLARTIGPITRIETQGAVVLLAGQEAYKIRRAIRLPFLDYSTRDKRRRACEREVEINRDSAPGVYLGVIPVNFDGRKFAFGGAGEIVDWATHMRRFDENATLDRIAERGGLTREMLTSLARTIHAMHERAPPRDGAPSLASLEAYLDQNRAAFAGEPDLFDPLLAADLDRQARSALAAARPLLIARGGQGLVRRCHGDLHLRNIVLIDGEPTPFDAIEFDEAIATGDILYDLAFALMDLWERGLVGEANLLMNAYLSRSGEDAYSGLAALPFFLSLRAAIRAKVEAANLPHLSGDTLGRTRDGAKRYFEFARAFLAPAPARLIAVGGLSGTGKSSLAALLAPRLGRAPGAVWLRSDVERKHLFGVEETAKLSERAYSAEASRETYARMEHKAALALQAGQSVIVDAVHAHAAEREATRRIGEAAGAKFIGLWLEAPLGQRTQRVERRSRDASDADADVVARQAAEPLNEKGWARLDASVELSTLASAARERLGAM